jgi:two-component system, NarL family, capsular synthesis sensor histidine kinase RcsC
MPDTTTILIADSDEISALYLEEAIYLFLPESFRYSVFKTENGYSALKACSQHTVGLIFIDLWLEDCDGLNICKCIKRIYPQVPLIIQTATFGGENRKFQCEKLCDQCLIKPISLNELQKTLSVFGHKV